MNAVEKSLIALVAFSVLVLGPRTAVAEEKARQPAPLKVLLVAGGCCHDYATQSELLKKGIEQRINAVVTVQYNPGKGTDTTFEIYDSPDWAEGYDVVVHDECSASVTDRAYVNRILEAHRGGVPAVNLHCAMHSYRWGNFQQPVEPGADNAPWYEMIGVQSTSHGAQLPIDIRFADSANPIIAGLENWTTVNEELYNNVRIFDGTESLARGTQVQKDSSREATAVVAWTNQYGPKKTRIFSTTLGHNNETVGDSRYLDLVTRGLLWATGHITDQGQPAAGYGR